MKQTAPLLLLAASLAATATPSQAQTLIDAAAVMAGNVTPGDAPGFPLELNAPGHYVLKGNLQVGLNQRAVSIHASNVTLDLNGFSIMAPGQCSQAVGSLIVTCNMSPAADGQASAHVGIYVEFIELSVNGDITTGRPEPSTRR